MGAYPGLAGVKYDFSESNTEFSLEIDGGAVAATQAE
jgi:hypothetical protein